MRHRRARLRIAIVLAVVAVAFSVPAVASARPPVDRPHGPPTADPPGTTTTDAGPATSTTGSDTPGATLGKSATAPGKLEAPGNQEAPENSATAPGKLDGPANQEAPENSATAPGKLEPGPAASTTATVTATTTPVAPLPEPITTAAPQGHVMASTPTATTTTSPSQPSTGPITDLVTDDDYDDSVVAVYLAGPALSTTAGLTPSASTPSTPSMVRGLSGISTHSVTPQMAGALKMLSSRNAFGAAAAPGTEGGTGMVSEDIQGLLSVALPPAVVDAVSPLLVIVDALLDALISSGQALIVPGIAFLFGFGVPGIRRRMTPGVVIPGD